jgi:hypothetical protein
MLDVQLVTQIRDQVMLSIYATYTAKNSKETVIQIQFRTNLSNNTQYLRTTIMTDYAISYQLSLY